MTTNVRFAVLVIAIMFANGRCEKSETHSLTQFFLSAVVKLVKLEVLSACHKEVFLRVEGGRVDGSWSLHCLDEVQAGQWIESKRKLLFPRWVGS